MSPVCLPFTELLPRTDTQDTDATDPEVAGWGAVDVLARRFADVLQYVVVPFSDTTNCTRIYKVGLSFHLSIGLLSSHLSLLSDSAHGAG